MSRKHRENQAGFLGRKGWYCDQSGRLWRHATLGPIDGTPLFKSEARARQLEHDRRDLQQMGDMLLAREVRK